MHHTNTSFLFMKDFACVIDNDQFILLVKYRLNRSPSPEPIYNQEGKRLNTRDYRTRKKLEEERHHMIQKVLKLNPEYKPPADYR